MGDSREHLDEIRRQFTRQADAYAAMPQTKDEAAHAGLVALVGAQPNDRVLDVACGPGFLTLAFARRCARAQGIDATAALLERARAEALRSGLRNVQFGLGNAEALPCGDATFDVVACRAAFHHFERPERVLAEMRRVVTPDGRLLVADMLGSEGPAKAAYHDRIERLCDPTHVRALPASEFERLFAAARLEVTARPSGVMHSDVEEWMTHGGPTPTVAAEIVKAFEDSLAVDRCGLAVRREDGRLRFSHTVAAFVLRPERAQPVTSHPSRC
jgi:ubiquinone/menaquinone biosynthesis C-methylase UbiE